MLWKLIGDYLHQAPAIVQTGVGIAISALVIMAPILVGVLVYVLCAKDVKIGPVQISSRKRRNRRAADRKK